MKETLTPTELAKVREAAQILDNKLEYRITIPELSVAVNLPEKKLKQGFMRLYQQGVHSYFTNERLKRAKIMLIEGYPLKSIAQATGYKNKTALIKSFKTKLMQTPRQWKLDYLKKIGQKKSN